MAKTQPGSNWVIAIGYILVASTILLNYIAQRSEVRQAKVKSMLTGNGSQADAPTPVPSPDTEYLQKQLDEERRVRQEMTEMMNRLQRAYAANPNSPLPEKQAEAPETPNKLPVLREGLLSTETRPLTPPPSRRNPFLPFFSRPSQPLSVDAQEGQAVSFARLRSNPVVPLPLTGSWIPIRVFGDNR